MQSDRRITTDRRTSRRPFHLYSIAGRRRASRRAVDAQLPGGSDSYEVRLFLATIGILLFCVADAHNTLLIMSLGGSELNPLMDVLIRRDVHLFVLFKLLLTGLGLLALVGYEYVALWRGFRVRHLLYTILSGYILLIGYQSVLMPEGVPAVVLY